MNPEIKERWVAALRSGKYPQAQSFLHLISDSVRESGYCCLGVLCEITPGVVETVNKAGSTTYGTFGLWGLESSVSLPAPLQDSAEIPNTSLDTLVQLNDVERKTFDEIADWIEENL